MVLSGLLLLGSAAHARVDTTHYPPLTRTLESQWEGGSCRFQDNRLTYADGNREKTIPLDVSVTNPEALVCSDVFSAVLTPDKAIATLGGERVLDGAEMLGFIGDSLLFANSYSIDIREPAAEGITGKAIVQGVLFLQTEAGRVWTLDLANPLEWRIY